MIILNLYVTYRYCDHVVRPVSPQTCITHPDYSDPNKSVCCVSLFLTYINNSATRVDKYNKYVKRYMLIQIYIQSVNSQQKMSKIEHNFHSTICPP